MKLSEWLKTIAFVARLFPNADAKRLADVERAANVAEVVEKSLDGATDQK